MVAQGDQAYLTWTAVSDLDVITGGNYWVRHTSNLTGATWAGSSDITKTIPGTADSFSVPLMSGSYLIKALDSSYVLKAEPISKSDMQNRPVSEVKITNQ